MEIHLTFEIRGKNMKEIIHNNLSFLPPSSVWDYLIILYIICFLAQLFIYIYFFSRLAFYKPSPLTENETPVSIIVCAKNERENLLNFLPLVLKQNYPEFEVIVVNDSSVDDTQDVLKAFTLQHKNLKVVTVPDSDRFYGNKKFALTLGIKAAKHPLVLLTDADCKPASLNWLAKMSCYAENKKIILGVGNYEKRPGILNALIRFETFYTAMHYLSFAQAKIPYMGVGRNLAYHSDLFFNNKGFSSHLHILSGDDDLFINEVATKNNTQICIDEEAHTISVPKNTYKSWIRQKRRHFLSGSHYKFQHHVLLGSIIFSQTIFIGLFFLLLFHSPTIYLIISLFLIRLITQLTIFRCSAKKIGGLDLILFLPFFEIFFILFNPFLVISTFVIKKIKWN